MWGIDYRRLSIYLLSFSDMKGRGDDRLTAEISHGSLLSNSVVSCCCVRVVR